MEQLSKLLLGQLNVLPEEAEFFALESVRFAENGDSQKVHQLIDAKQDRVNIAAPPTLDELNVMENDAPQASLFKLVIAAHDPGSRSAVAAPNSFLHGRFPLASTENTVIRKAVSSVLKQKTIASHLPSTSVPSTRYFQSPVLVSGSGSWKMLPILSTRTASCRSSASFSSSLRKCRPDDVAFLHALSEELDSFGA